MCIISPERLGIGGTDEADGKDERYLLVEW